MAGLTINTSAVTGVTNLNVIKAAGAVSVTAAATTDTSVAMTAAGAAVDVAGGKNVTVNLADVAGAADVVSIGVTGAADPAGIVAVTMTGKAYTAVTANTTLSAVNVTGGTTITVAQKAAADTTAAAADTSATTITEGAVAIVGNANTTAVTVNQDATVAPTGASFKTGGVTETVSVKFTALTAGQTLTMGGLTFTAPAALTASQAAAAFSNLVNNAAFAAPASISAGDTQSGGSAAQGTYTNIFSGYTSSAASGDTVVFTSTTANSAIGTFAVTGSGSATATISAGKAHDAGATGGVMGVSAGAVTVNDASATIKTITINGYGTSSTTGTTVLETLNLSNAAATVAMTVASSAATLALNLEKIGTSAGDAVLTITAAPTTLNVKSTGANYVNLTANATLALNVSGTGVLKANASDLLALKTVVVTETAGLMLNAGVANTVTSVNTSGTTGAVTVTIEGARATYTGGAGVDTVSLATDTALTKVIDLGAGNDTLVFGVAVTGSTAALNGGDGVDTLSMTTANAVALSGATQSFYTNFEHLTVNDVFGTDDSTATTATLDLAKLGFTNYVTTSGTVFGTGANAAVNDTLVLDNMATNGTVVLTANGLVQVNVTNAATGLTDVLNTVLSSTGNLTAGTLTAANVETINISTVDTEVVIAPAVQEKNVDTLTLTADKATTVHVTGAADLTLTMTGSTNVTSIDGSAMTGGLTVTSLNTTSATTITGGSGNDVLTAATGTTADILLGGAGNDTLVANKGLSTLTGGAGNDIFQIGVASANVNSYSSITDFAAGDSLQLTGATSFAAAKVSLGDTAVFQDYANAAVNALAANASGWFQFAGNTYVVEDAGTDSTSGFINGQDFIVKLTGLVDLSSASFNSTHSTIALV